MFTCLRTYALCGQRTRIPLAIVVLILAAVIPGALNMVGVIYAFFSISRDIDVINVLDIQMLFFRESVVFQLASPENACILTTPFSPQQILL